MRVKRMSANLHMKLTLIFYCVKPFGVEIKFVMGNAHQIVGVKGFCVPYNFTLNLIFNLS